jgi:AcrR family transcriptional regulator
MWVGVNINAMSSRTAYHHGDLRNALVDAASRLAERGGPDAVTIRAAAREVGVTPTAAYRHFTGHEGLLQAAKQASLARMSKAMRKRLASLPDEPDPVEAAIARLEAIGYGYVDFALAEPGLFRTAFCRGVQGKDLGDPANLTDPDNPHVMLIELIDELVRLGFLAEEQRLGAETGAWSMVHGLSMLLIDGPLAGLPEAERNAIVDQTLTTFTQSFWNARQPPAKNPRRRR